MKKKIIIAIAAIAALAAAATCIWAKVSDELDNICFLRLTED